MFSDFRISSARIISADDTISDVSTSTGEVSELLLAATGEEKEESAAPVTIREAARNVTTVFLPTFTGNTSSFMFICLTTVYQTAGTDSSNGKDHNGCMKPETKDQNTTAIIFAYATPHNC